MSISKVFHLGANPDLLPHPEQQLEGGDIGEAVEHEERQLANRHSAEQLCWRVGVLRPSVHRGVDVPVPTVGHHLLALLLTFGLCRYFHLGKVEEGFTLLLSNKTILKLSQLSALKSWQLGALPATLALKTLLIYCQFLWNIFPIYWKI